MSGVPELVTGAGRLGARVEQLGSLARGLILDYSGVLTSNMVEACVRYLTGYLDQSPIAQGHEV